MPYASVPDRLLADEDVPVSEVLGYYDEFPTIIAKYWIDMLVQCGVISETYSTGVRTIQITAFGHDVRRDLVKRVDGDCPECP
jgi:hypothetical protein